MITKIGLCNNNYILISPWNEMHINVLNHLFSDKDFKIRKRKNGK